MQWNPISHCSFCHQHRSRSDLSSDRMEKSASGFIRISDQHLQKRTEGCRAFAIRDLCRSKDFRERASQERRNSIFHRRPHASGSDSFLVEKKRKEGTKSRNNGIMEYWKRWNKWKDGILE